MAHTVTRRTLLAVAGGAVAAKTLGIPAATAAPAFYGAKYEPADGRTYTGVGQSYLADVVSAVQGCDSGHRPVILAFYDLVKNFASPRYLVSPSMAQAQNLFPGTMINYGLQLPSGTDLGTVGAGGYDSAIDNVGRQLRGLNQKMLVRIGYEFDLSTNGYGATAYRDAFRRIVDRWRTAGVDNVATVFCSHLVGDSTATYEAYYPGDDYVDWVGFDIFNGDGSVPATGAMYTFAATHQKPLMLGEASKTTTSAKAAYLTRFMDQIDANPTVKGFQQINRNWSWSWLPTWGDAMYSEDPAAMAVFRDRIQATKYITLDGTYFSPVAMHVTPAFRAAPAAIQDVPYNATYDHRNLTPGYGYQALDPGTITIEKNMWKTTSGQMLIDLVVPPGSEGYVYFSATSTAGFDVYLGARKAGSKADGLYSSIPTDNNTRVGIGVLKYRYLPGDVVNGKVRLRLDDLGTDLLLGGGGLGIQCISPSAPAAPAGLGGTARPDGSVPLTWSATAGAMRYNVYRNGVFLGAARSTSFIDTTVPYPGDFTYWVTASSEKFGEGRTSAWHVVHVAPAPAALIADAFVRDGTHAATNFGTLTALEVKDSTVAGYSRRSYLRFNLAGIGSVATATLRVYGRNSQDSSVVPMKVFGTSTTAWSETGVTWSNAPAVNATPVGSVDVGPTAQYYSVDVTSLVSAQVAAGATSVTVALATNLDEDRTISLNSRESTTNRPQLVIVP